MTAEMAIILLVLTVLLFLIIGHWIMDLINPNMRKYNDPRGKRIMKDDFDKYGNCPECGSSWDGGDIPENSREHYSEPYKWSRVIGIEDPKIYDGVSWWRCPDCKAQWDRQTGELIKEEKNEQA